MTYDNSGKERFVPEIGADIIVAPKHGNRRRMLVRAIYNFEHVTYVTGAAKHLTKGHLNGRDWSFVRLDQWSLA